VVFCLSAMETILQRQQAPIITGEALQAARLVFDGA
jgi:hypothetical protein